MFHFWVMSSSATFEIRLEKKCTFQHSAALKNHPAPPLPSIDARQWWPGPWTRWAGENGRQRCRAPGLESHRGLFLSPAFPRAIFHVSVMDATVGCNSRNGGLKRPCSFVDLEEPEDELTDLLTYTCSITGQKRCPPCLQLDCILIWYCDPGQVDL